LSGFAIKSGATRIVTRLGPIELTGYQPPVSAHQSVGFHNIRHILKRFSAEAMVDFQTRIAFNGPFVCKDLRTPAPR